MDSIDTLLQFNANDIIKVFLFIIASLSVFQFVQGKWKWFWHEFLGAETKLTKHEKEQTEQIQFLKTEVIEIKDRQKDFIQTQNQIIESIGKLNKTLVEKEVDDMRWDMLNFANALMAGREYNKEQFDHALSVYSKYSAIIKDNNLTNEQVDISMEFVKEKYQECLKNGFLNDK